MHTVKEWKAHLQPKYREALEEMFLDEREVLSPREVVDAIVGYEVVCLVNEAWGIQLPAKAMWEE